jgi:hypothetical protein
LCLSPVLIGMINCGITGNILDPPFSSKSWVPRIAKNLYGSIFSLNPSKKIGK